jgi:hypothetical protein
MDEYPTLADTPGSRFEQRSCDVINPFVVSNSLDHHFSASNISKATSNQNRRCQRDREQVAPEDCLGSLPDCRKSLWDG